ncbi:MAG: hypothetical protein PHD03_01985 [Bacilli bacterium]|nr:hypothetical protein [Bacilli bacterium]MDD4407252.1 hypothetical protein [Bacilli bacterium]
MNIMRVKNQNNKFKKGYLSKVVVLVVLLLLISIGVSFAFFTANISNSESATTITVGGGTLNITYSGGSTVTVSNIHPRPEAWATKTFTVSGTTATATTMNYKCTLVVSVNSFSANALKYQMTATNTGSNGTPMTAITTSQNIGTGTSNIPLGNGSFVGPVSAKVHTYVLTIYFPDTEANQNADQGKEFNARITTDSVAPV